MGGYKLGEITQCLSSLKEIKQDWQKLSYTCIYMIWTYTVEAEILVEDLILIIFLGSIFQQNEIYDDFSSKYSKV